MLRSMTGFGRGEAAYGDGSVTVEVTTVNARYLDVSVRGLREHGSLELKARAHVGERLARGAVSVNVVTRGATPTGKRVTADVELAREYVNEFERLRYALGLKGRFPVEALTSGERFLVIDEEEGDEEAFTESLLAALEQALERAVEMREGEGAKLAADLETRLGRLEQLVDDVGARAPAAADAYRKKLTARARELAESATVDPARLEAEVALFAERSDISEEVTRCRAHTRAFAEALASEGRVGRRLDFLTVEMNREANTIAAKAQDAVIASSVIEIKDLLEQMREQVQNIE
ncbi:MAG: YicC family protein [candidate division Zixibacteria bacterium]|nr:YicC family protein [candidate division Zixibacteria bacterium]